MLGKPFEHNDELRLRRVNRELNQVNKIIHLTEFNQQKIINVSEKMFLNSTLIRKLHLT